jgi:hypothetical protein
VLRCPLGRPLAITVVNDLPAADGGTTVHWHGMRQHGTPWADGVPGLTQVWRCRRQRRHIPADVPPFVVVGADRAALPTVPYPSTPGANALVY